MSTVTSYSLLLDVLPYLSYYADTKALLALNCSSKVIRNTLCDDGNLWNERLDLDYGAWSGLLLTYTKSTRIKKRDSNNDEQFTNNTKQEGNTTTNSSQKFQKYKEYLKWRHRFIGFDLVDVKRMNLFWIGVHSYFTRVRDVDRSDFLSTLAPAANRATIDKYFINNPNLNLNQKNKDELKFLQLMYMFHNGQRFQHQMDVFRGLFGGVQYYDVFGCTHFLSLEQSKQITEIFELSGGIIPFADLINIRSSPRDAKIFAAFPYRNTLRTLHLGDGGGHTNQAVRWVDCQPPHLTLMDWLDEYLYRLQSGVYRIGPLSSTRGESSQVDLGSAFISLYPWPVDHKQYQAELDHQIMFKKQHMEKGGYTFSIVQGKSSEIGSKNISNNGSNSGGDGTLHLPEVRGVLMDYRISKGVEVHFAPYYVPNQSGSNYFMFAYQIRMKLLDVDYQSHLKHLQASLSQDKTDRSWSQPPQPSSSSLMRMERRRKRSTVLDGIAGTYREPDVIWGNMQRCKLLRRHWRIFDMPSEEELLQYENEHLISSSNAIFKDNDTNHIVNSDDVEAHSSSNNASNGIPTTDNTGITSRRRRRVVEEIDGDGVIGQFPELEPLDGGGEYYSYASCSPQHGVAVFSGYVDFQEQDHTGNISLGEVQVRLPAVVLDKPTFLF